VVQARGGGGLCLRVEPDRFCVFPYENPSSTKTRAFRSSTPSLFSRADKEQRGSFIRDERTLVVWSNSFDEIVPALENLENKVIQLV
jgi:hypothetical protein